MIGIYKITNPSGKVYIGKSFDIKKRWSAYRKMHRSVTRKYLHASFKKYGVNNHTFEIILNLPKSITNEELVNLEIAYIKDYKNANVPLLNLTDGGEGMLGYKHSDAFRKRNSEIKKGNKYCIKPVVQLSMKGKVIKEWDSATDVKRSLNIDNSEIGKCCKDQVKSAGGYRWRYKL